MVVPPSWEMNGNPSDRGWPASVLRASRYTETGVTLRLVPKIGLINERDLFFRAQGSPCDLAHKPHTICLPELRTIARRGGAPLTERYGKPCTSPMRFMLAQRRVKLAGTTDPDVLALFGGLSHNEKVKRRKD